MNFLKLFLRAIALIPGVVQGTEALFGAKTGEQKKKAAVEIVGAAINIADAVTMKHIADASAMLIAAPTISTAAFFFCSPVLAPNRATVPWTTPGINAIAR